MQSKRNPTRSDAPGRAAAALTQALEQSTEEGWKQIADLRLQVVRGNGEYASLLQSIEQKKAHNKLVDERLQNRKNLVQKFKAQRKEKDNDICAKLQKELDDLVPICDAVVVAVNEGRKNEKDLEEQLESAKGNFEQNRVEYRETKRRYDAFCGKSRNAFVLIAFTLPLLTMFSHISHLNSCARIRTARAAKSKRP